MTTDHSQLESVNDIGPRMDPWGTSKPNCLTKWLWEKISNFHYLLCGLATANLMARLPQKKKFQFH